MHTHVHILYILKIERSDLKNGQFTVRMQKEHSNTIMVKRRITIACTRTAKVY